MREIAELLSYSFWMETIKQSKTKVAVPKRFYTSEKIQHFKLIFKGTDIEECNEILKEIQNKSSKISPKHFIRWEHGIKGEIKTNNETQFKIPRYPSEYEDLYGKFTRLHLVRYVDPMLASHKPVVFRAFFDRYGFLGITDKYKRDSPLLYMSEMDIMIHHGKEIFKSRDWHHGFSLDFMISKTNRVFLLSGGLPYHKDLKNGCFFDPTKKDTVYHFAPIIGV